MTAGASISIFPHPATCPMCHSVGSEITAADDGGPRLAVQALRSALGRGAAGSSRCLFPIRGVEVYLRYDLRRAVISSAHDEAVNAPRRAEDRPCAGGPGDCRHS